MCFLSFSLHMSEYITISTWPPFLKLFCLNGLVFSDAFWCVFYLIDCLPFIIFDWVLFRMSFFLLNYLTHFALSPPVCLLFHSLTDRFIKVLNSLVSTSHYTSYLQ